MSVCKLIRLFLRRPSWKQNGCSALYTTTKIKNEFLCSEESQRLNAAGAVLRQFLRQSRKRSLGQVTGESQMSLKILIGVV